MLQQVLQLLVIIWIPFLAMKGAERWKILNWLGPVVLCYLIGIFWANIPQIPVDKELSKIITMATVPLAIPLLLFSMDFVSWMRLAKATVLSFALAIVSVLVCAGTGAYFFADKIPMIHKVTGMLVGVYTGGTPNLTAIGMALEVADETYIKVHASDVMVGALYFLPLLTVAPLIYRAILPKFKSLNGEVATEDLPGERNVPWNKERILSILAAIGSAMIVVGACIGISFLFFGEIVEALVILGITTGGIACSFIGPVRRIRDSYDTGQYFLLMFCVAIGTVADLKEVLGEGGAVVLFVAFVMIGAIFLHLLLAVIFRVDADTVLITSTAAIYGPPFIGPVAGVLKNREVVVSGLTTGVVGLAIGNYAGLGLAYLVKYLVGN